MFVNPTVLVTSIFSYFLSLKVTWGYFLVWSHKENTLYGCFFLNNHLYNYIQNKKQFCYNKEIWRTGQNDSKKTELSVLVKNTVQIAWKKKHWTTMYTNYLPLIGPAFSTSTVWCKNINLEKSESKSH